jgi:hypothetical protein
MGGQLLIKLIVVYIFLVFWMPYPEEHRLMRLGSLYFKSAFRLHTIAIMYQISIN